MLSIGDIVSYRGSLFIVTRIGENHDLLLSLIHDTTKMIHFDDYYQYLDDLFLVVENEHRCIVEKETIKIKKDVRTHGLT